MIHLALLIVSTWVVVLTAWALWQMALAFARGFREAFMGAFWDAYANAREARGAPSWGGLIFKVCAITALRLGIFFVVVGVLFAFGRLWASLG